MSALGDARAYLAKQAASGVQATMHAGHPDVLLARLVAEIEAAPTASIRHNEDALPELDPWSYNDMRRIKALEGRRVRLVVIDTKGGGNLPPPLDSGGAKGGGG